MVAGADAALHELLADARTLGFVGPGPVEPHLTHARRFVAALATEPIDRALDLGSGAGLPGLVLAVELPAVAWVLLDANQRRAAFLRDAVDRLGLGERVAVREERAELAGRDETLRGRMDAVVARAFGAPAVVAECGAPFLRTGGVLVVSEPPEADPAGRWPDAGLASVGLARDPGEIDGVVRLRQVAPCLGRFPRRVGVPAKRPLF
jgi:16S rRNA (guanine527-N7)-methyltransferase